MVATYPLDSLANLYAANTPHAFWHLLVEPQVSSAEWADAVQSAASVLSTVDVVIGTDIDSTV